MKPLDRTDKQILEALQNNARLSNKELAHQIGLAPSSCLERVRRLQEAGVFLGFHADVDPRVLGIGLQALVSVRLRMHSRELIEQFLDHVLSLPEVSSIYHLAGENDYLIHVAVRESEHLRELILTAFAAWGEVAHIETAIIFEHRRKPVLPSYVEEEG